MCDAAQRAAETMGGVSVAPKSGDRKPGEPRPLSPSEQRHERVTAAAKSVVAEQTAKRDAKTARLKAQRLSKERAEQMVEVQKKRT